MLQGFISITHTILSSERCGPQPWQVRTIPGSGWITCESTSCLSKSSGLVNSWLTECHLAVCQNLVPLVNIKIAGKWMFIPLKMVLIGIDPYPNEKMMNIAVLHTLHVESNWLPLEVSRCIGVTSDNSNHNRFPVFIQLKQKSLAKQGISLLQDGPPQLCSLLEKKHEYDSYLVRWCALYLP